MKYNIVCHFLHQKTIEKENIQLSCWSFSFFLKLTTTIRLHCRVVAGWYKIYAWNFNAFRKRELVNSDISIGYIIPCLQILFSSFLIINCKKQNSCDERNGFLITETFLAKNLSSSNLLETILVFQYFAKRWGGGNFIIAEGAKKSQ